MDSSLLITIIGLSVGIYFLEKRFNSINSVVTSLEKRFNALVDHLENTGLKSSISIEIAPENFKLLFDHSLILKSFDPQKVDLLDKKPSEIDKLLSTSRGWLKNQGMDKESKSNQKKYLIFTLCAQKIMNINITYLPKEDVYFMKKDNKLEVLNRWVNKKLYRESLIYKDRAFATPNVEFIIQQRNLNDTLVLTGYLQNEKDETYILFDFPILLDKSKEIANKYNLAFNEIADFLGKDNLGEDSDLHILEFRSNGMLIQEFRSLP